MARHIENFNVECYRGLKDLQLQDLNDINILTGNNNSGKTSVLELISSLNESENLSTWIKMCRLNGDRNYYTGILNLFPTVSDDMRLHYSYYDSLGKYDVALHGIIQEERISEREIDRINGVVTEYELGKNVGDYNGYKICQCTHISKWNGGK